MKIARLQMEKLTQAKKLVETLNFDHLLQQLEVSFDQKVDCLTRKKSINQLIKMRRLLEIN